MKKLIIKEYDKPFDLAEVYQKSGLTYAFVSTPKNGSAMCHPFVKCRDFLHDAVRAMVTYSTCSIYGFKYDSKVDPPIDLIRIRMRLKYENKTKKEFSVIINDSLKLLHYYENILGGKIRTTATCCVDGTYVVSGPNVWLRTPILTTLFTLLFRVSEHSLNWDLAEKNSLDKMFEELITRFKDKINNQEYKDLKYLSQIYKNLQTIVENYLSLCEIYSKKYDDVVTNGEFTINTYHNNGGIVSLCTGNYMLKKRVDLLQILMSEQKMGKALIRLQGYKQLGPYTTYQPNKLDFAFVSSVNDIRLQCTPFTNCREQLIGSFRSSHKDSNHLSAWKLAELKKVNLPNVDDEKLRVVARVPGVLRDRLRMIAHKKELFFAKRVINYYEKYLGMKKSVISTVLIKYKTGVEYGWLFTSSNDWLDSPVMLSLYITLIRSAKIYMHNHIRSPESYPIPDDVNNKEVKKMWSVLHKYKSFVKLLDDDIHVHSALVHKILKNRKILFGVGTVQEKFFIGKNNLIENIGLYEYSSRVGIHALLKYTHIDKKLVANFKEIEK